MRRFPLVCSILFLLSLVLAFCITDGPKSFAQPNEPPFNIGNKTQSLEVVGITNANSLCKLSVKNNSTKVVKALVLSPDGRAYEVTDFLHSDTETGIPPSGVYQATFSVPSGSVKNVGIISAVFEDGSSEGDPEWAGAVRSRWLGMTIQYQKIKSYLESIPTGANGEISDRSLEDVISQLSSLSDSSSNALLEIPFGQDSRKRAVMKAVSSRIQKGAFEDGLHVVTEVAILDLQKLKDMHESSNEVMKHGVSGSSRGVALSNIKQRNERENSLRERLIVSSADGGVK